MVHKRNETNQVNNEQFEMATNFVQDDFFEKGHWWLKTRQVILSLTFSLILIFPILILLNSIAAGRIWSSIYFWQYADGFQLSNYLESFILLAVIIILVISLMFLFRNNYQEAHVYPKRLTYDEVRLQRRKIILEHLYSERFGTANIRYESKYYVVQSEQNFSDTLIEHLFDQEGVAIK